MREENAVQRKVLSVALEDIADEEGFIVAEGIIAEDVVSENLAVLLPAGMSLHTLKETYPKILIQLSKHGVTYLKIKDYASQKEHIHSVPADA